MNGVSRGQIKTDGNKKLAIGINSKSNHSKNLFSSLNFFVNILNSLIDS
ncbi:hypothetical protein SAMN05661096_03703 [Marivirga sericea]|uniref:Uncharacterized protein n=1 Tax=Marivirga sericea TaxID=1028 RepID=A0A1X7LAN2_9BACT|nr:hypothetical protein SAMN05661096_03703 [Marivirga sericea]